MFFWYNLVLISFLHSLFIEFIIFTGSLVSVTRTCSSVDMGMDCRRRMNSEDISSYVEVCHDTCNKDGCNSAISIQATNKMLVILNAIVISYVAACLLLWYHCYEKVKEC